MSDNSALFSKNRANPFYVSRLMLKNFRNYESLSLDFGFSPIVITGKNGSGKTNILEAVSFLSPGRGLRSIKLEEADRILSLNESLPWTIAANVNCNQREYAVGTGRDASRSNSKRAVKIDGENAKGQSSLAEIFSVMWLTPQMDGLFLSSSSDRRKFLDRLVYNFDPEHSSRVYSYEYSMRERAKLLQNNGDINWILVLESKMAERAVAIAAARLDAVEIIQKAINIAPTHFPKADIAVEGMVEKSLQQDSALLAEESLCRKLFDSRAQDQSSGRTNVGAHKSDFVVVHRDKQMAARACSTGEQKSLLLSIIMAEARAKSMWKNSVPVLLLDEVVAHLDGVRREALFAEFLEMGTQVWMTGTDVSLFEGISAKSQLLNVDDGRVSF